MNILFARDDDRNGCMRRKGLAYEEAEKIRPLLLCTQNLNKINTQILLKQVGHLFKFILYSQNHNAALVLMALNKGLTSFRWFGLSLSVHNNRTGRA